MKSFQQKDCFAAIPGKSFFFPTMHEFINRITVNLEFHLKMHLYNIFPSSRVETRGLYSYPFSKMASSWRVLCQRATSSSATKGGPPGIGPYLHQVGPLSCLQGKRCLAAPQITSAQNERDFTTYHDVVGVHGFHSIQKLELHLLVLTVVLKCEVLHTPPGLHQLHGNT